MYLSDHFAEMEISTCVWLWLVILFHARYFLVPGHTLFRFRWNVRSHFKFLRKYLGNQQQYNIWNLRFTTFVFAQITANSTEKEARILIFIMFSLLPARPSGQKGC